MVDNKCWEGIMKLLKNVFFWLAFVPMLCLAIFFIRNNTSGYLPTDNAHRHTRNLPDVSGTPIIEHPYQSIQQEIITDQETYKKYYQRENPPAVNFDTQAVVCVRVTELTSGYAIEMIDLEKNKNRWVVKWRVKVPWPGDRRFDVITQPTFFRIIPKPNKPVVFQEEPAIYQQ
jgi:hypothetical protein